jgi:hypothetical protein
VCFIVSFFPATFWAVIGFLVLLGASKADGGLKTFGHVLGIWACVLAVLIPLGGLFVSVAGLCPIEAMMEQVQTRPAR